jgi:hypothetical protein
MKKLSTLYAALRALLVASVAGGAAGVSAQSPASRDAAAWEAARQEGTVEAYQRYLEEFPIGSYADKAFRSIVEMTVEPEAVPVTIVPAGVRSEPGLVADLY